MTDQQERVAEFARELREGPGPSDRSIKEIVDALRPQLQELAKKQVELSRMELTPVGKQAGVAAGLLVVGAVFLLVFLILLSIAGVFGLAALGLSQWLSALIVAGVLLVVGGVLAGSGAGRLRSLDPKPHRSIQALQQNVEWIKGRINQ